MDDGSALGYFIVWIVLSILIGVWAKRKGRSNGWWFFLSLMLSPIIGAACVLCMKNLNTKTCPACAEPVRREASVCKHCRTKLSATGEPQ